MVDIETLSSDPTAVVLSIGAVTFSSDRVTNPFFRSVEIFSSLMAGCTIDPNTVEWWRQQSDVAKQAAQPLKGKLVLVAALEDLAGYLQGADEIWAKGPDFDLVVLSQAYRAVGLRQPWSYRYARDCRTIYALSGVKESRDGLNHSAVDDAINQAQAVIKAYEILGISMDQS